MTISYLFFVGYVFFAIYCAGSMTVLQLQHFALYSKVGRENFRSYIAANNKAAVMPAIFPAIIVFILSGKLSFARPDFMPIQLVIVSLVMNLINIASTAIWQGRIHAQLEDIGFDEKLLRTLVNTNWIRTIALLIQGFVAAYCVLKGLK